MCEFPPLFKLLISNHRGVPAKTHHSPHPLVNHSTTHLVSDDLYFAFESNRFTRFAWSLFRFYIVLLCKTRYTLLGNATETFGALDLGGSSTQITFLPQRTSILEVRWHAHCAVILFRLAGPGGFIDSRDLLTLCIFLA